MNLNLANPIVFFDLETTGINIAKDRIVEISVLKVYPNGKEEQKTIRVFYDKRTEELMYRNEEEVLPIRLLSSGFRTLIGMVLDIAYRMAILYPFMKKG